MAELKLFKINCKETIYFVSGNYQKEAVDFLAEDMLEKSGELDAPLDEWIVSEITEPIKIVYDEVDDDGEPIVIMSNELLEGATKPEIVACSEY